MSRTGWLLTVAAIAACGCGAPAEPSTEGEGGSAATGWQRLPDSPLSGRTGAVVAAVNDEVVVIGGWEFLCPPTADCDYPDRPLLRDGAVLDPESGEWQAIADAPYGVRDAVTATLGSDLYVLSGCRTDNSCRAVPALLRLDVRDDRWEELAALPEDVYVSTLVPLDGGLLALSDSDEGGGERADHLYDVTSDTWREVPDDPLPSTYDRFAFADRGRLLLFGSPRVRPDDEAAPKVAAAYDLGTEEWTRMPDAPGPGYQVWRIGDEAWLNSHFGTSGGGVLDLGTERWRPPPAGPGAEDWSGDMAGIMGVDEAVYEYDAGWVRDTRTDEWRHIGARPDAGYDASLTAVGDALVTFGGQRWEGNDGELLSETWLWRPPA